MNTKYMLTLIACFTAGGFAGFLLSRKLLEEKYVTAAEEDAREVREYYLTRPVVTSTNTLISEMEKNGATDDELDFIANMVDKYQQHQPEDTTSTEHYEQMRRIIGYSNIRSNPNEEAKRNYNLVGTKKQPPIELIPEEEEDEVNPIDERPAHHEPLTPYLIDEPSFSEEFIHEHEKVCLVFYAEDGVLTEEDESVVMAPTDLVGFEALESLPANGKQTVIYVRNERLAIDYEILIDPSSYQRKVLGIEPGLSPREQQERRTKERDKKKAENG